MTFIKTRVYSAALVLSMLLSACSSHIPPQIRQNLEGAPGVAEVRDHADSYLSQRVRWGGVILHTENRQNTSRLTILGLPLNDSGKPRTSDKSTGRFIAIVDEFLEPLLYSRDRQITVTGKFIRTEIHKVGDYPYEYPVVEVEHYYLWPEEPLPSIVDYPPYWRYDPWFYPDYYPWPYYPYRLNHYHH